MHSRNYCWNDEDIAIVNGFVFPDGLVRRVDEVDLERLPARLIIRSGAQFALKASTGRTSAHSVAEASDPVTGLTAVAGECGMGADGFVALFDAASRRPRWVLFFDFSNPFEKVAFVGARVVATNNLHQDWLIPIDASGFIDVVPADKA